MIIVIIIIIIIIIIITTIIMEKGVELQMSCAECVVNRPKVCRTYWRVVRHSDLVSREAQRSS